MAGMIQRIKETVANNIGLKALAVALAALSFYAIRGATDFEIGFDVPLEIAVEKGVAILEQDAQTVHVVFRGSPDDLGRLEQKSLKAVVRPKTKALSGTETFAVLARQIEGAEGVRVVRIKPDRVALTFDREAEKVVQVVKPKTTGKPLLGRVDVEYEPKVVTLRGPRLRLIDKETVTTEPVDVDGRVQSFTRTVRVLPPGDTWVSQIDPAEITVRVNILTRTETRVREALPVQAMISPELGAAVRFTPPSVSVTLEGRAEELDALDEEKLKVFVDCGGLEPWCDYELPVRVHLPPGTDVAATVEPATVHVFLGGI